MLATPSPTASSTARTAPLNDGADTAQTSSMRASPMVTVPRREASSASRAGSMDSFVPARRASSTNGSMAARAATTASHHGRDTCGAAALASISRT